MKVIIYNNCPLRNVNLQDKTYYCFVDNEVCNRDSKIGCKKYEEHCPRLESKVDAEERQFDEDRKYLASKGLVF